MRIALAQIIQESNSFAPTKTTRDHFASQYIRKGNSVFEHLGDAKIELTGMLSVLELAGAEPVPLLATHGSCGGPLTGQCFDSLLDELIHQTKIAGHLDGVLLALHGSMAAEGENDCESKILERLRQELTNPIPIGVSLDLHAHVTPRMLQPNVFFVGYAAYPHVDMFETGVKTATILINHLRGKTKPIMALAKRPMIISPVNSRTTEGPMTSIVAEARSMEEAPRVLAVSYFMVQPWLDFQDLGFAALVCTDDDEDAGKKAAEKLADLTWAIRDELLPPITSLKETIHLGLNNGGTTVIADCGDATSGGAAGDNVTVLSTLLEMGVDKISDLTYITLVDAPAALKAAQAGVGATINIRLGHSLSVDDGKSLKVNVTVRAITDGVFTMGAGLEGAETHFGLTAVLVIGSLRIAVRSTAGLEWDVGQFTSVGLDLQKASLIFVKSPSHFRATFSSFADLILTADTPGAARINIREVRYKNIQRPIHPLDPFD